MTVECLEIVYLKKAEVDHQFETVQIRYTWEARSILAFDTGFEAALCFLPKLQVFVAKC